MYFSQILSFTTPLPLSISNPSLRCLQQNHRHRPQIPYSPHHHHRPSRHSAPTIATLDNNGNNETNSKRNPYQPTGTPKFQPLTALVDFISLVRNILGFPTKSRNPLLTPHDLNLLRDNPSNIPSYEGESTVPEVLVVGATGETGRIIVRKLLLRGFKVRVLVRNLYSKTLDLLGTGVSYIMGDVMDYYSLAEAVGGVDKVICTVKKKEDKNKKSSIKDVEYDGVKNLIRAFEDSKLAFYGREEATKVLLFNFGKQSHFNRWKPYIPNVVTTGFGETMKVGNEITNHKSFSNGGRFMRTSAKAPRIQFGRTDSGRTAFMGQVYEVYNGKAEVRCIPANFNLKGFSGLVLRCVGDGKRYSVILRTPEAARINVLYKKEFETVKRRWLIVRLPLSEFQAVDASTGQRRQDAPELDRGQIRQIGLKFAKPEVSPERDDGRFYLAVEYLKTYRTQEEPDFVLLSCASVSTRDFKDVDEHGLSVVEDSDAVGWKYLAEKALRNSGLTYCIVRAGQFTEQAGGNKALMLEQSGDVSGAISRADVAEVCVKSLLDPRACNVTFDVFESMYAPTARTPSDDLSALLGRLRPNT